jgi:hypothetical protein
MFIPNKIRLERAEDELNCDRSCIFEAVKDGLIPMYIDHVEWVFTRIDEKQNMLVFDNRKDEISLFIDNRNIKVSFPDYKINQNSIDDIKKIRHEKSFKIIPQTMDSQDRKKLSEDLREQIISSLHSLKNIYMKSGELGYLDQAIDGRDTETKAEEEYQRILNTNVTEEVEVIKEKLKKTSVSSNDIAKYLKKLKQNFINKELKKLGLIEDDLIKTIEDKVPPLTKKSSKKYSIVEQIINDIISTGDGWYEATYFMEHPLTKYFNPETKYNAVSIGTRTSAPINFDDIYFFSKDIEKLKTGMSKDEKIKDLEVEIEQLKNKLQFTVLPPYLDHSNKREFCPELDLTIKAIEHYQNSDDPYKLEKHTSIIEKYIESVATISNGAKTLDKLQDAVKRMSQIGMGAKKYRINYK